MVPELEQLARHGRCSPDHLKNEAARVSATMSARERGLLHEALTLANRTANTDGQPGRIVAALANAVREVASSHPPRGTADNRPGRTIRRSLTAKVIHVLREAGLYRDGDGVEPVWAHAGMLILNPILGCSFGCAYCFRADEQTGSVDAFLHGSPTQVIDDDEVVRRLARHPLFVPGKTQLGLHSATTEPFLPQVRASTFGLLDLLEARGWRNDVMIITKHYLRPEDVDRLAGYRSFRILLFLTYNAAPAAMETMGAAPEFAQRQRRTVELLSRHPHIAKAHYFRPIVPGWNDTPERLADALTFGEPLGLTVIGGLKAIPNLLQITEQRQLPSPSITPSRDGNKHFPPELVDRILAVHSRLGLTSTIVGDQSCGLTVMLSRALGRPVPNVEAVRMYDASTGRRPRCMGRCSTAQLEVCARPPAPDHAAVRHELDRLGIEADLRVEPDGVHLTSETAPSKAELESLAAGFRYAVHHHLAGRDQE